MHITEIWLQHSVQDLLYFMGAEPQNLALYMAGCFLKASRVKPLVM